MIPTTVLWSRAWLLATLAAALIVGLSAFLGSLVFTSGIPTVHSLEASAWAALVGMLIVFIHALGGTQMFNGLAKMDAALANAKHSANASKIISPPT